MVKYGYGSSIVSGALIGGGPTWTNHTSIYTFAGDTVGSGSTLIASQKTNRNCYGMEIDPHYIDVIVQRYINYTQSTDNCYLVRDGKEIPLNKAGFKIDK